MKRHSIANEGRIWAAIPMARHHYIAQSAQLEFADETSRLWMFEPRKPSKGIMLRNPKSIFRETNRNTYENPDGTTNEVLEDVYGYLDDRWINLVRLLKEVQASADAPVFPEDLHESVCRMISGQIERCPDFSPKSRSILQFENEIRGMTDLDTQVIEDMLSLPKQQKLRMARNIDVSLRYVRLREAPTLSKFGFSFDFLEVSETGLNLILGSRRMVPFDGFGALALTPTILARARPAKYGRVGFYSAKQTASKEVKKFNRQTVLQSPTMVASGNYRALRRALIDAGFNKEMLKKANNGR